MVIQRFTRGYNSIFLYLFPWFSYDIPMNSPSIRLTQYASAMFPQDLSIHRCQVAPPAPLHLGPWPRYPRAGAPGDGEVYFELKDFCGGNPPKKTVFMAWDVPMSLDGLRRSCWDLKAICNSNSISLAGFELSIVSKELLISYVSNWSPIFNRCMVK